VRHRPRFQRLLVTQTTLARVQPCSRKRRKSNGKTMRLLLARAVEQQQQQQQEEEAEGVGA